MPSHTPTAAPSVYDEAEGERGGGEMEEGGRESRWREEVGE